MNIAHLRQLVERLAQIQPHHDRITCTLKDPQGYLTPAGKKHARVCLNHAGLTIQALKTGIINELGA